MVVEFYAPTRILFGVGALARTAEEARGLGRHALVVTGTNTDRALPVIKSLAEAGVLATPFAIPTEPTVTRVREGVRAAKQNGCDLVIGFGGGSAIDGAKAIAALMANPGEIEQYLEVVGDGNPIAKPPVPFIAIPTTAGTGAEVTRNAVLKVEAHNVKVSMRSPLMLPTLAVIDPETTLSMTPAVTASTGLDALAQVLEPFVSKHASPITDALCREGMRLASTALKRAFDDGSDIVAREAMCRVSLFGGLALANAKLGAVHGFAGPLGGMFDAPHGVICGLLLPPVIARNIAAVRSRKGGTGLIDKFTEVAKILTGSPDAVAEDGATFTASLGKSLDLPPLSRYGVARGDIDEIVRKSQNASSMKGNPVTLTRSELCEIVEQVI